MRCSNCVNQRSSLIRVWQRCKQDMPIPNDEETSIYYYYYHEALSWITCIRNWSTVNKRENVSWLKLRWKLRTELMLHSRCLPSFWPSLQGSEVVTEDSSVSVMYHKRRYAQSNFAKAIFDTPPSPSPGSMRKLANSSNWHRIFARSVVWRFIQPI